jgi:hypothetical protein
MDLERGIYCQSSISNLYFSQVAEQESLVRLEMRLPVKSYSKSEKSFAIFNRIAFWVRLGSQHFHNLYLISDYLCLHDSK